MFSQWLITKTSRHSVTQCNTRPDLTLQTSQCVTAFHTLQFAKPIWHLTNYTGCNRSPLQPPKINVGLRKSMWPIGKPNPQGGGHLMKLVRGALPPYPPDNIFTFFPMQNKHVVPIGESWPRRNEDDWWRKQFNRTNGTCLTAITKWLFLPMWRTSLHPITSWYQWWHAGKSPRW